MRIFILLCLLTLLVVAVPGQAQTQPKPPLVVFVEEPKTLSMSSVTDPGPDGLTRLAQMFRDMGARTQWNRLTAPLPADTKVVVLVRPGRPLPTDYLARMWEVVANGGSLLLALDPRGYMGETTDGSGSGIDTLVSEDEGVSLRNGILIEPWFDNKSFESLFGTFSFGLPDPVPNPVSDPVRQFDLPVALWGARPVTAEAFGVDSNAWALADALPQYVETDATIFPSRTSSGSAYQLNLNKDQLGRVNIAGIGENTATGAHVAILGDAEFVQNGYGLAMSPDTQTPMFPANYIITQRLAAWLLGVPESQYPPLPTNMTWVAIDGSINDWPKTNVPITPDGTNDATILSLNIQQVRAFHNDSYLYMSVETVSQPNADSQIDLQLSTTGTKEVDTVVSMRPGNIMAQHGTNNPVAVPDAAMAIGTVIELRLPLRITGLVPHVINLCLSSTRQLAFPQPPDCMEAPIQIGNLQQADPAPLRLTSGTVLAVRGDTHNRINVRMTPSDTGRVITTVPYGSVYAAVGRTADSQWVQIENAAFIGWIGRDTLFTPENLTALPVTG